MSKIFSDYTMIYLKEFYASKKPLATSFSVCSALCSDTKMKCDYFRGDPVYFSRMGWENCHKDCELSKRVNTFADLVNVVRNLYINVMNTGGDIYAKETAYSNFLNIVNILFQLHGSVFDSLVSRYKISFGLNNSPNPPSEFRTFIEDAMYYKRDDFGNMVDENGDTIDESDETEEEYLRRITNKVEAMVVAINELNNTINEITG